MSKQATPPKFRVDYNNRGTKVCATCKHLRPMMEECGHSDHRYKIGADWLYALCENWKEAESK
jgi:hypothetical protein